MKTLLVLGSKPNPELPPPDQYDDVACANGSVYSAYKYGLSKPKYTVLSSYVTSGRNEITDETYHAICGLGSEILFFLPSVTKRDSNRLFRYLRYVKTFKRQPLYCKVKLWAGSFNYEEFIFRPQERYISGIEQICNYSKKVIDRMKLKLPSTGVIALSTGIRNFDYGSFILSGFSLDVSKEYMEEVKQSESKHKNVDISVLDILSKKYEIKTTEKELLKKTSLELIST